MTDRTDTRTLADAIRTIEEAVGDPTGGRGLPFDVFLMVTRLVPLFTVDLLVQDERGCTLLTWRDDEYFGTGWHVPGGAVRYKETIAERIATCAREELGAEVTFDPAPLAVEEEIDPHQRTRGHNIALLYRCRLVRGPDPALAADPSRPQRDQWAWHDRCPQQMLPVHQRYSRFLSG